MDDPKKPVALGDTWDAARMGIVIPKVDPRSTKEMQRRKKKEKEEKKVTKTSASGGKSLTPAERALISQGKQPATSSASPLPNPPLSLIAGSQALGSRPLLLTLRLASGLQLTFSPSSAEWLESILHRLLELCKVDWRFFDGKHFAKDKKIWLSDEMVFDHVLHRKLLEEGEEEEEEEGSPETEKLDEEKIEETTAGGGNTKETAEGGDA